MNNPSRVAVVANPSKFDDPAAVRARVEGWFVERGLTVPDWFESTPDDPGVAATEAALDSGAELVCAFGGDGTVRAVGGVLAGTDATLGLLPAGTGNLLARNLDLPLDDLDAALEVVMGPTTGTIDVGMVRLDGQQPQPFLVIAGVGLDAEMMAHVDDRLKRRVGWLAYLVSGAKVVTERGFRARAEAIEAGRWRRVRSVMVCNCGALQGGLDLVPEAHPADGRLDVLELSPRGAIAWLHTGLDLLRGRRDSRHVEHASLERIRVELAPAAVAQLDGDATSPVRVVEAWVEPAALRVKLPRPLEPSPAAR